MPPAPPPQPPLDGPLGPADAAAVRELARVAAAHDGIEALSEQTLLDLTEPGPLHWLARGTAAAPGTTGPLVAYAQLGAPIEATRTAELVVAPGSRRAGLGRAVLAAVTERAAATGDRLLLWAHGDLPGARALADGAGWEPARSLWRMARDLPGETAPPAVEGLRPFVVGQDEEAWVELNRRAFADHPEQGRLTVADLRAREAEPWFRADDLLLVERNGRAVAYLWLKVEPPLGELYALGIDPAAQGHGLGTALTARAVAHLTARGADRAVLYTDADNTAAVRAYTAAGFRPERVDLQYAGRAARSSPEDATMPS